MTLSHQWDAEDLRWLKRLAEKVPLAEGRMEIHTSLFAAAFRLTLCLAFTAFCWAMVATRLWQEEMSSLLSIVVVGGCGMLGSMAVCTYGKRTYCGLCRRPEFVLSKLGLAVNGRLLRWSDLTTLVYECKNRRGYRSHTCKITLRDGDALSLDLDTASLPPSRIMLLIDFYAAGAPLH